MSDYLGHLALRSFGGADRGKLVRPSLPALYSSRQPALGPGIGDEGSGDPAEEEEALAPAPPETASSAARVGAPSRGDLREESFPPGIDPLPPSDIRHNTHDRYRSPGRIDAPERASRPSTMEFATEYATERAPVASPRPTEGESAAQPALSFASAENSRPSPEPPRLPRASPDRSPSPERSPGIALSRSSLPIFITDGASLGEGTGSELPAADKAAAIAGSRDPVAGEAEGIDDRSPAPPLLEEPESGASFARPRSEPLPHRPHPSPGREGTKEGRDLAGAQATIRVEIGRVEVRAVSAARKAEPEASPPPRLSLDEYLRQRQEAR